MPQCHNTPMRQCPDRAGLNGVVAYSPWSLGPSFSLRLSLSRSLLRGAAVHCGILRHLPARTSAKRSVLLSVPHTCSERMMFMWRLSNPGTNLPSGTRSSACPLRRRAASTSSASRPTCTAYESSRSGAPQHDGKTLRWRVRGALGQSRRKRCCLPSRVRCARGAAHATSQPGDSHVSTALCGHEHHGLNGCHQTRSGRAKTTSAVQSKARTCELLASCRPAWVACLGFEPFAAYRSASYAAPRTDPPPQRTTAHSASASIIAPRHCVARRSEGHCNNFYCNLAPPRRPARSVQGEAITCE